MNRSTIATAGNPGLTPEARERLQLATDAARVRLGLTTDSRGPVSLAGGFVKLLRRLGVAR